jgi:hypothetical protein
MEEIKNILRILKETESAIKNENTSVIKKLSNETLHSISTSGDPDNISIAVIIYSIGKIFERPDYHSLKGWESFKRITLSSLEVSIKDLENGNIEKFRKDFFLIRKAINKISGKLRKYIEDVFKKAEINKASKIYEHGISLEKTAKMLGVSLYDLQQYAGQTQISEYSFNLTINTKTRIKFAEEIFK